MSNKQTIGERVDKVVDKMSKKMVIARNKISTPKDSVGDIAGDISKSVKKAVCDSGDVISVLIHKKK